MCVCVRVCAGVWVRLWAWRVGVGVSGCVGVGVVRGVSVKGVDFHSLHSFFFSNV